MVRSVLKSKNSFCHFIDYPYIQMSNSKFLLVASVSAKGTRLSETLIELRFHFLGDITDLVLISKSLSSFQKK